MSEHFHDLSTWSDADLVALVTERYKPSVIPPCSVCGAELVLQAHGGGEPDVWVCPAGADGDAHSRASRHVDRRAGGDRRVMELVRRFGRAAAESVVVRTLTKNELVEALLRKGFSTVDGEHYRDSLRRIVLIPGRPTCRTASVYWTYPDSGSPAEASSIAYGDVLAVLDILAGPTSGGSS